MAAWLASFFSSGVPILLYHRVGVRDGSWMDRYTVSPDAFTRQMKQLSDEGWNAVPLDAIVRDSFQAEFPDRTVVITFDDGFATNREHAWPVLQKHRFPATTFLVTGRIGQRNSWDGAEKATWPLLSHDDVAAADPGLFSFHSHSATHADLCDINDDLAALRSELVTSREGVSATSNGSRPIFAYPFGSWSRRTVAAVQAAGYVGACTCMEGLNRTTTNPYLLRRVEIDEKDLGWRLRLKLYTGRSLAKWPPARPPEVRLIADRLRRKRAGAADEFAGFCT